MRSMFSSIILLFCVSACSQDSADTSETKLIEVPVGIEVPSTNLAIPDNRFSNMYQVLIFGNSHVTKQASLIQTLITTGNPNANVEVHNAGGGFLDDNLQSQTSVALLENEPWTHVILQGQKYSQSGATLYSTTAAQVWIDKAKSHAITPILFPEHPQKGNKEEGSLVHLIHTGIAQLQKACVAPVGLAWDKALEIAPRLVLHQDDGNHATLIGNLLTALIFYEVITGESADLLPYISAIEVEEGTQQLLGQIASETIQANQPCLSGT